MSQEIKEDFEGSCRNVLGNILGAQGYVFEDTYVRPRGIAVEFSREADRCFVVNEGGAVICDLIRRISPAPYYRISLNELLWFHGVRSLPRCQNWADQLAVFAEELPAYAAPVLSHDEPTIDSRYCFPMSEEDGQQYLKYQRGR